jgi:DNA transposition AAA+ family ATPase
MQKEVKMLISSSETQAKAAEHLGITPGQIGYFRDGDWANIGEKTFLSVQQKLNLNAWSTYTTNNFAMIVTAANSCKEDRRMQGLLGFTGAGKTHALKQFSNKFTNSNYVLCDSEMTKLDFVREISKSVGVKNFAIYNKSEIINNICRMLIRTTNSLLILDDVGKLSDANMRVIQIIYDKTEGNCGILLVGLPSLKKRIDRSANKDVLGFRELRRRIAYWEELKPVTVDDIKLICADNGITDESAIAYLTRECRDFGTLRNMITNSLRFKEKKAAEVINNELLTAMNRGKSFS